MKDNRLLRLPAFILGLMLTGLLGLMGCATTPKAPTATLIQVDILFDNQPGVPEALSQLDTVLSPFNRRTQVTRYDLSTLDGAAFAKEQGFTTPSVLAVFINGSNTFDVNGRTIVFAGLSHGEGKGMIPDGSWTIADFAWVLNTAK